jgi:uracil phosphoribosyltransferase
LDPLPRSAGRPVFVLDPMLATGCSLLHCCQLLAHRGARDVTVIGL